MAAIRALTSLNFYQTLFYFYLTIALLIFAFLVPPFQKNDEPAHFHRAVSITNLDFVCSRDADGQYYFPMKRKYVDLPEVMHTFDVAFRYNNKFKIKWLSADFSDPKYDEPGAVYRFCSLTIPGYLPNALGVLLGKPFENPLVSFYLARLFGASFFALSVVLALRVIPERFKLLVYLYAVMPTVLHQVSAVSYDAVQLSLFPLILAYLIKFTVQDEEVRPRQLLIFMALLWWVINIKLLAYYPLILLFFVIPRARIATAFSRYLRVSGAFLALTGLTTGFFDLLYLPRAVDPPGGDGVDASAQVRFVIAHPVSFLNSCYDTVRLYGEGLFRETIGVFGWVDYTLNFVPYYVMVFVAGAVFYYTVQNDRGLLRPGQIALLGAVIILTSGSLFFSLYVVWSPVGNDIVWGLQGRYFVGLAPFVLFLCSQTAAAIGKDRALKVLLASFALLLMFNIFRAVQLRYY